MTLGEVAFIALIVLLLALGVWKFVELGDRLMHRFGQWRSDRRRTGGNRLELPGNPVIRRRWSRR